MARRRGSGALAEAQVAGPGGTWRDGPWYMSAQNIIWEIERPDSERQSTFFVVIDGGNVRIVVAPMPGGKELKPAGRPLTRLGLPEWRGPYPA